MALMIVNPAGGAAARHVALAPRLGRPGSRPVYLFSNSKSNLSLLFDHLADHLQALGHPVKRVRKLNPTAGCPEDLLGQLAQDAGWVITAIGD